MARNISIPPAIKLSSILSRLFESEPEVETAPTSMITPAAAYNRRGGLFDINRDYYIFQEKHWDLGGGDILDEKGNLIGRMKRKILSIRRRVSLLEVDGTVAAVIHAKIISARGAQELKDPEGNLIAKIRKKY